MTVCIAAICQWGEVSMVVGASDRMLTVGDRTEYEPPQHKVYRLTDQAVILIAGDTSAQTPIGQKTQAEIISKGIVGIADMADIYAGHFAAQRRKEAEAALLAPLGLMFDTFLEKQRGMSPAVVEDLNYRLQKHHLGAAAIITGLDKMGAHIFTVRDPGIAVCQDREGFAAIGIGDEHAMSQFMFAKYTPAWSLPRALLLTYSAKRRAEVAPGVGLETDMFYVEPGAPCDLINVEFFTAIYNNYEAMRVELDRVVTTANEGMQKYVEETLQRLAEEKRKALEYEAALKKVGAKGQDE